MGQTDTTTGTWSLSGSTITITPGDPAGGPETITGTVDGDTITLSSPEEEEMPFDMVFKKRS